MLFENLESTFWYSLQKTLTFIAKVLTIEIGSSRSEVFLGKGVLKKCSKFTGEHPCRSEISVTLQSNFIKITLWR